MPVCARLGCCNAGKNKCSACLNELYCGGDCQKLDWKLHKQFCAALKNISYELQPYQEVVKNIEKMREKNSTITNCRKEFWSI